jgi:hypothetical protein
MAITRKRPEVTEFDDARLEQLSEPITMSVWRFINGQPTPITLPVKPGEEVAGKGWSRDDVRKIHEFLPMQWTGGGQYKIQATGTNGEQLKWRAYWPENEYKPMVPPPMRAQQQAEMGLAGAAAQPVVAQPVSSIQWLSSYPVGGAPNGNGQQVAGQYGYFPQQGFMQVPPPNGNVAASTPFRGGSDERLMKEREERIKLENRLEREKQEAAHKADMERMTQELRRLQEASQSRPAIEESAALKSAHDKIAALEQQNSTQMMMQQMQTMQQQNLQMMAEMKRDSDQRFEALQRQLSDDSRKGPDPMLVMLMESSKTQAQAQLEAQREQARTQIEIARMQAEAQREQARTAFTPREMADLMKGNGTEQMMHVLQGAWQMNQQAIEAMIAAQGPGVSPAMQMLGQGVQAGTDLLQRYIDMKEEEGKNTTRQKAIEAQARVVALQQQGAQPAQIVAAMEQSDEAAEEANEAEKELREQERELFGVALGPVQKLREEVAADRATPEQAAHFIVEGIQQLNAQGIRVPAFDAWQSRELGRLVDGLIPDAPQSYRLRVEEVLQQLWEQVAQAQGVKPPVASAPQPSNGDRSGAIDVQEAAAPNERRNTSNTPPNAPNTPPPPAS